MINQIKQKKIFLETYGCQMNEYDSQLVRAILKKENYEFVTDERKADIIMLNTCSVREHAHRKVYGRVHHIRHARGKDSVMIGILGCMATNLRKDLLEDRSLKIDFIAGPDSYKHLPQLIHEASDEDRKSYDVTLSEFETYSDIYPSRTEDGVNAWIAVMRGCNNFCTFCVVPYTRGRERSRSPKNVVDEARRLAVEGFKQITLLGQNVNSYRYDNYDFAYLMDEVSKIDGIKRIRFTSPHPKDFPDRFLDLMAANPKICKHIHLPLQAGNNRILDMMNRTYTSEDFVNLVDKIRTKIPNVALTTDIIVGFPTETDGEFEDTIQVVAQAAFDSAFTFKYSQRQGTIASKEYPDDVSEAIKTERIMCLNEIQKNITLKKNQAHIGQVFDILIEPIFQEKPSINSVGRTDGNKLVILSQNGYKIGDMIKTIITGATPHALKGDPSIS